MGAIFGFLASLSITTGEIFARRISNEVGPLASATIASGLAAVVAIVSSLIVGGSPTALDLVLGGLSGFGFATGIAAYLTGVQVSSSAVVGPITAALTTLIPFGYAAVSREIPSALAVLGALTVLVGLVLVTAGGSGGNVRAGVPIGVLAGVGYGVGTALLIEVSDDAGQWPIVPQRVVAVTAIAIYTVRRGRSIRLPADLRGEALLGGSAAGLSSVFILAGVRVDAATASVTANLFPASSVLAGRLLFRDAVSRAQVAGLVIVLAGVAAIVTG